MGSKPGYTHNFGTQETVVLRCIFVDTHGKRQRVYGQNVDSVQNDVVKSPHSKGM